MNQTIAFKGCEDRRSPIFPFEESPFEAAICVGDRSSADDLTDIVEIRRFYVIKTWHRNRSYYSLAPKFVSFRAREKHFPTLVQTDRFTFAQINHRIMYYRQPSRGEHSLYLFVDASCPAICTILNPIGIGIRVLGIGSNLQLLGIGETVLIIIGLGIEWRGRAWRRSGCWARKRSR